ncbi:hypothetical protein GQ457_06G036510 [Hibiscus cannabinus]
MGAVGYLRGKSLLVFILKIAWNAHLYAIWEERNCMLFRNTSRRVNDIIGSIMDTIRIKMHCKVFDRLDHVNRQLISVWGIL